jgi:CheY-like chemotaxis protein
MNTPSPLESGAQPVPSAARRKLRILVADDDRDTVMTLATLLRCEGYEVRSVFNGTEAAKAARLARFDAVILDISMPELSGYAIAQEVRKHHYGTRTRAPLLIAISGKWKKPSEKLLAQAVGFDHHLEKPCDPQVLIGLLKALAAPLPGDSAA